MKETRKKIKISRIIISVAIILLILFVCIILYSYFVGTSGLNIREYNVYNKNIPDEFYGLKIIQISDIHYGFHFNKNKLEKIVKKINELNPDIVVLTGDIIDKKINDKQEEELKEQLSYINASIGKYAIKGNHDYNYKNWDYIIKNSGFINLNDSYDIIYGNNSNIMISGVSTNLFGKNKINDKLYSSKQYIEINSVNYKILLVHEPDYIDEIKDISFDLVLASHGHNGQFRLPIFGALYNPKGAKKYHEEFYKVNKTDLYISGGLGTTTINLRLFNKPSFNLYRLTN